MALIQTDFATGVRATPHTNQAGQQVVHTIEYTMTLDRIPTVDDIVELGFLPAFHKLSGVMVLSDGFGAGAVANLGFMSGEQGSREPGRTVGNDLAEALDLAAEGNTDLPVDRLANTTSIDDNRPIGLQFTSAPTITEASTLKLVMVYAPVST